MESGGCSLVAVHGLPIAVVILAVWAVQASVVVARGLIGCGLWVLEHGLHVVWHLGLVAPLHVEFSQARDRTCVPCMGR